MEKTGKRNILLHVKNIYPSSFKRNREDFKKYCCNFGYLGLNLMINGRTP